MAQIFPIDFEEKLTMAQDDYILFSDSEDGNKIKKAQYKNLKGEQGDPGTPGAAATITVGSTTTGAAGSSASVTNSGTSSAAILDFTIPQGAKGEPGKDGQDGADGNDGEAATITIGTTTTLSPGSSATVTNVGTSSAAILDFGIPQGTPGTGSGDVVGPASSTDGHIAVFDGATGKIIKDGGAIPTGDVGISSDTGNLLTAGANLWFGTETDFSSISTPDTNTLYIQYKSDGGGGFTPGVNTIAYYPLDSTNTVNDLSGNNHTLTNSGITFGTYNGVDCAYNAGSNYMTCDLGTKISDGSYTLNVWAYKNGGVREIYVMMFGVGTTYSATCMQRGSSGTINYACWFDDISTISTYPTGAWTNIVFTYDKGTRAKHIYVNGVEAASGTGNASYNLGDTSFWLFSVNSGNNDYFYGNISNFIIEDKARTAQEVSDYFDLTKANYGIS